MKKEKLHSYSYPFPGKEWEIGLEFIEKKLISLKLLITHCLEFKNAAHDLQKIYFEESNKLIKAMFLNK